MGWWVSLPHPIKTLFWWSDVVEQTGATAVCPSLSVLYIRLILCQFIYLLWVSGVIAVMAAHQWQLTDWLGSCRSDAVWQEQIVHQFICSALSENHFYFCHCSIWHTSLTFVLTKRPGIKEKERPFVDLLLSDVHWSWGNCGICVLNLILNF